MITVSRVRVIHRVAARAGAAIVSLLLALLLVLPGTAGATPSPIQIPNTAGPPGPPIEVQFGTGASRGAIWYRQDLVSPDGEPILSPGQNVAVIYYRNADNQIVGIARESNALESPGAHSERVLKELVEEEGINPDDVVAIYSEFEPCSGVGMPNCAALVARTFRNAQQYYSWKYTTPEERAVATRLHRNTISRLNTRIRRGEDVMNDSCSAEGGECVPGEEPLAEDGPLAKELSDPAEALDPGGIDFTSLQLSYVSLGGPHKGEVQYAMNSDGAPVTSNSSTGLQTAQQDSNAFFTWLTLSPRSFWVNLAPNYPPRVIDPSFALTDAGRVLLQSDLLLKESVVPAENPASPSGLQFWQGLVNVPRSTNPAECLLYRIWIVPGVATVHASRTQLYILDAPLKVKLAVITHLPGKLLHPICPQSAFNEGYLALFRRLIVPELTQEVNTAPQFEPLRRVYMSRVAAQWVRQEAGRDTVLGRLVNSGLHRSQLARPRWSPTGVWDQYLQVYGAPTQYTFPVQVNGVTTNYTVTALGGVDFTHKIPEANTSNREFKARWPGLAAAASRSSTRPSTADGTILVGGGTTSNNSRRSKLPRPMRLPRSLVPRGL